MTEFMREYIAKLSQVEMSCPVWVVPNCLYAVRRRKSLQSVRWYQRHVHEQMAPERMKLHQL